MNRLHRRFCRSPKYKEKLEHGLMPWVLGSADLGDATLEIGPGPGLTTELLQKRAHRLTAVEIDPALASGLASKVQGVEVVNGDATDLPFETGRFDSAVCLTMLHHVPSAELQDRLLGEVCRVLRPGGLFIGSDSTTSLLFRLAHLFDTMVLVDPDSFGDRLARAGFGEVEVNAVPGAFRFRAQKASLET
jgi:SAM-dependent methyltransferase